MTIEKTNPSLTQMKADCERQLAAAIKNGNTFRATALRALATDIEEQILIARVARNGR